MSARRRLSAVVAVFVVLGGLGVFASRIPTFVAQASPSMTRLSNPHMGKAHPFPGLKSRGSAGKHVNPKEIDYSNCSDAAPCGSGDLAYNNGPVQENPAVYVIFWGPEWNSGSAATTKQIISNYFGDMGHTGFENTDTQYYDSTQHVSNSLQIGGVWVDTSTPPTETTNCLNIDTGLPQPAIDESSYVSEVQNAIATNHWADDPNNATYFVYTPSGDATYSPGLGCSTLGGYGQISTSYCAFHNYYYGATAATSYAYAVMPWPDHDGVLGSSYCLAMETPNSNSPGDSLVSVSSHEQTEAITDPQVGLGWIDSAGYEIGDKCAWIDNGNATLNNGGVFSMQPEYTNFGHTCLNFSRTWYFAEGYTGNTFTTYLTLENPTSGTAHVAVQYLLGTGSPITKSYTVNGNSRSTIIVNGEVGANQDVSMVVFSDTPIVAERPMYFTFTGPGTTPIPGGTDALGANQPATQFDFGYLDTTSNHFTYLTILNENEAALTATIHYYPAGGGSAITTTHTVNGNSRGTVYVGGEGLAPGSYSALVTLSLPGLVERPMYFVDSITGYTGSADVIGKPTLSSTWDFAEGYTSSAFSERYYLSNPTATTQTATVTFYLSNGTTQSSGTVTLNPGHQAIVNANAILGSGGVDNSTSVAASGPILAERVMSFQYPGANISEPGLMIPGATDVLGVPAPDTTFQFAEGYTGTDFAEYLTLENPGGSSATVNVTYLPTGGSPVPTSLTVAAHSRTTVFTNSVMPSQSFSMTVTSTVPIVAERPMYFAYNGTQTGGTDVIGYVPVPAS